MSQQQQQNANSEFDLFKLLGNSFTIPTDEASLRKLFCAFDRDNSGTIDYREFSEAYRKFESAMGLDVSTSQVGRKFRECDKNRDNALSFEEFAKFMIHRAAQ